MDNKVSVIIAFIVIIVVMLTMFFIINREKSQNNNYYQNLYSNYDVTDIEDVSLEEDIQNAIRNCYEQYKKYRAENFEIYFSVDNINDYLERGKLSLVNDFSTNSDSSIEIYNIKGEKIEGFPEVAEDGSELNYEKEAYQIEANKTYLIKMNSYRNDYTYYYLMTISNNGKEKLIPICFTTGEIDESMALNIGSDFDEQ